MSNTYDKDVSKIHCSKIIDIGCGTGLLSEYLDKFKYQIDVDGLDFSNEMLEVSRQRNYYTNLFQKDVYTVTSNTQYKYDYGISVGMFTHNHVEPRILKIYFIILLRKEYLFLQSEILIVKKKILVIILHL